MNKDKARIAVPEDLSGLFMQQIWIAARLTGMDKIPAVCHHIQFIQDEINRHCFNNNHQVSSHDKDNAERRKFIAIFRNRYLESTDFEYPVTVTPIDGKLVAQTNKALNNKGFTCDEYLKWLFEVFLPENTKFLPITIKFSCCAFALTKFFFENKDLMKEKQEAETKKREALSLMTRGRQVIRQSQNPETIEKVKNIIKNYADGRIVLDGMRKGIDECEKACSQETPKDKQKPESEAITGE